MALYTGCNLWVKEILSLLIKFLKLKLSRIGPRSFTKSTFCPSAYGTIKISEKIIAESKSNLFIG